MRSNSSPHASKDESPQPHAAAGHPASRTRSAHLRKPRRRWGLWVAIALVALWAIPIAIGALIDHHAVSQGGQNPEVTEAAILIPPIIVIGIAIICFVLFTPPTRRVLRCSCGRYDCPGPHTWPYHSPHPPGPGETSSGDRSQAASPRTKMSEDPSESRQGSSIGVPEDSPYPRR